VIPRACAADPTYGKRFEGRLRPWRRGLRDGAIGLGRFWFWGADGHRRPRGL